MRPYPGAWALLGVLAVLGTAAAPAAAQGINLLGVESGGTTPPDQQEWFVHCDDPTGPITPRSGCACVDHDMNSYNPVQAPAYILWGPGSFDQCGAWMQSQGLPW